jgi:hypothetical protein
MKGETNRLGEKPQFDERANEDGYFAVKEHEPRAGCAFESQVRASRYGARADFRSDRGRGTPFGAGELEQEKKWRM